MRIITFIIFLFAITSSSYSQNYYKLIGDTSSGFSSSVKKCHSGGYILWNSSFLKGYNYSMVSLCRLDSTFNIIWHIYLPDHQVEPLVEEASNGDFYIISTNLLTLVNEICKIDPAGNIIWRKEYMNANPYVINFIRSTAIDNYDNLYLIYESNQAHKGLFAKIDSAGNILWYKGFCTDVLGTDDFSLAHMGYDSCLYILGSDANTILQVNDILIKSDLNGNIRWVINLSNDFTDFSCLPNGELILSTTPHQSTALPHDPMLLLRIDSSGHALSTINVYSQDYSLYESSIVPVNDTIFQIFGYVYSIPPGTLQRTPYKLTMDTAGHVLHSVLYNDTSIHVYSAGGNLTTCPDLSVLDRDVDGIYYQGLIFDPDTNGICVSSRLQIDSVFLDYTIHLDTMTSVILSTTRTNASLIGSTLQSNFSQDGCLVNQTGNLLSDKQRPLVFPNPFDNQFQISIPLNDEFVLELYNVSGKLIYKRKVIAGSIIDTRNYPQGIYYYILRNSGNRFTGKIIK